MSGGDDWAPGDLALCIADHACFTLPTSWEPRVGGMYTVAAYIPFRDGLELEEDPDKFNPQGTWDAPRFIKVTPGADITGKEVEARRPVPLVAQADSIRGRA